jgi:acyl-CoA synthetase (AMP-forming)/AMP-acid ligase II
MNDALTVPHLCLQAASRWPDGLAVIDGTRRVTFGELADQMRQVAAAFVRAGLDPGDRVALWLPNSLDYVVACLGLQAAGGTLVPLNTRYKSSEAQYILARSAASMVVLAEEFLGVRYGDLLAGLALPALRRVIRVGGQGPESWGAFLGAADAINDVEAGRRLAALSPAVLSDIMFTSGTTGDPKGAMSTHEQTVRTARLWARATGLSAKDRFLILWPFFHTSGYKAGFVACLDTGAAVVPQARLDVPELLDTVEREQVTFLPGPPTLFNTLLATTDFNSERLKSVRVSVTGASSVAPSLIEAMRSKLKIPIVLTGYGMTETCGTATMTCPQDPPELVARSCGRAIEGIEVRLMKVDGSFAAAGESAEVVIRGMNVMRGYLDDPVATRETIDPQGWLHTGDVGVMDAAGYLTLTDRKKDMFIVGGFNCYPAEIERALAAHPAILQAAVIGVPDERMGEVGRAFVVLKPGHPLDADALIEWSRERMANFKVPRSVVFLDSLPTNATGKVQKFKLRAL